MLPSRTPSRVLGQEEHNVMLALGLVRAAARTLLSLEPQVLRASELIDRLDTPRETAAIRGDLKKVAEQISHALADATFDGRPMFEGETAMFDVEDTRQSGEPLRIALPDLASLVHAETGLVDFAARKRTRLEAERMAEALRSGLGAGRAALRDAEQQLSVLLTHFHRQRSDHPRERGSEPDLVHVAVHLRDRVMRAGHAALAAQGELSIRASSLVLNDDPASR